MQLLGHVLPFQTRGTDVPVNLVGQPLSSGSHCMPLPVQIPDDAGHSWCGIDLPQGGAGRPVRFQGALQLVAKPQDGIVSCKRQRRQRKPHPAHPCIP